MISQLTSPVSLLLFARFIIIILLCCMTFQPCQGWFSDWVQNHNANNDMLKVSSLPQHVTRVNTISVSCRRPKQESWAGPTRCSPQKDKIPIQLFLPFMITLFMLGSVLAICITITLLRLIKRVQEQCLLITFSHIIQHKKILKAREETRFFPGVNTVKLG